MIPEHGSGCHRDCLYFIDILHGQIGLKRSMSVWDKLSWWFLLKWLKVVVFIVLIFVSKRYFEHRFLNLFTLLWNIILIVFNYCLRTSLHICSSLTSMSTYLLHFSLLLVFIFAGEINIRWISPGSLCSLHHWRILRIFCFIIWWSDNWKIKIILIKNWVSIA